MSIGDTNQTWERIVELYDGLSRTQHAYAPMAALVAQIAQSPYRTLGLAGSTSVDELVIGPSVAVFDNPHLLIALDREQPGLVFRYRDRWKVRWTRHVSSREAFAALERFLTKRARWYKRTGA